VVGGEGVVGDGRVEEVVHLWGGHLVDRRGGVSTVSGVDGVVGGGGGMEGRASEVDGDDCLPVALVGKGTRRWSRD
jgi:hypothetical protein